MIKDRVKRTERSEKMLERSFIDALDRSKIEYLLDLSLREYSSFHIGGIGEIGIFPKSVKEMSQTVEILREYSKKYHVIGNASNILFSDGKMDRVFVFTEGMSKIERTGDEIYAEAGAQLSSVAVCAMMNSLGGLEFAGGIPGSVGGGIFMNAGAYGGAISDVLVSSDAIDVKNGEIINITEHEFGYRESIYSKNDNLICLGGRFKLSFCPSSDIKAKMKEFARSRIEKQPLRYPSAGSYFKRPSGHFAGKLIEDCGLKGYRVGDAAISEKHAGFIINLGNATAADVLKLEEYVKERVLAEFGVELEREVRYIGD